MNLNWKNGDENMKIVFKECKDEVIFEVHEYGKLEEALKMCFYQNSKDHYYKSFPKSIGNMDKIKKNYKANAELMFSQLSYFSPIPWEDALYEFVKMVEGKEIDWWLVGSCAACIRGIKMNPHDVDIMINSKDIDKINDIFEDYLIEPIIDTNGWLTKDFGVIFMQARIDIATDPHPCLDKPIPVDCGPYAKEHLEEIEWRGYNIKVPPVQLQINANERRGRLERVRMLKEYIDLI